MIITSKEMINGILEIMEDVAADYHEDDRERLKAVMLNQLGIEIFNGLKDKNT